MPSIDVDAVRAQFPALARAQQGRPVVYFDGPAGSQVPQIVLRAANVSLAFDNSNTHGPFAMSRALDGLIRLNRQAVAALLGAPDPDCVAFGPNMTTLVLGLSRALARDWGPGDEIVLTALDHDANITPWVLAAQDRGATVRMAPLRVEDGTLDLDALQALLCDKTRLVAVTAASNALGSLVDVRRVATMAHAVGAEILVDAVHYAPHRLIDVVAWDCDYLLCSAYKFFGPHVGILWGRRELLEAVRPYKVRPAADAIPECFETGTQNHEGMAGTRAAVDHIASLGEGSTLRARIVSALASITTYEQQLCKHLLQGLVDHPHVRVHGISDPERVHERTPTVAITDDRQSSEALATRLGAAGIQCWWGDFYAVEAIAAIGLTSDGVVRIGLLHYNTLEEVDRLLLELR